MKNAFLTELPFTGKIPKDHTNLRVEFVWMLMADAEHHNIWNYKTVQGYDQVFVIIPKGKFTLNVEGSEVANFSNPVSPLLSQPFIKTLKDQNSRVYVVQEGPSWITNDWSVIDQVQWFSNVMVSDGVLCHNVTDIPFFKGLFPHLGVKPIGSWMIIPPGVTVGQPPIEGILVGGNFSRWYGGFQSYVAAKEFNLPITIPTSHSMRSDEHLLDDVTHLPRLGWLEWMNKISGFKWAVHLMPTSAAGSFSLNTGYWGIPTIGNEALDTQRLVFPDLSCHPEDVERARELAKKLREDKGFDQFCRDWAKERVWDFIWDGEANELRDGIQF